MISTNDRVIAITTRRRPMFRPAIVKQAAPAPAALLACLTILLDQPDSLHTILLIAETRGVGAGKVALELARKMTVAGIGSR